MSRPTLTDQLAVEKRINRGLRSKIEKDFKWITEAKKILKESRDEITFLRKAVDLAIEDTIDLAKELELSQNRANYFMVENCENTRARFALRCREGK